MLVDTRTLVEDALDYAVAKARGYSVTLLPATYGTKIRVFVSGPASTESLVRLIRWQPTADWLQAGALIDDFGPALAKFHEPTDGPALPGMEWACMTIEDTHRADGPDARTALCRNFVLKAIGEQVDIPDCLLSQLIT